MKGNMYYILENQYNRFYTEAMANHEFPSLQAAQDKLQALQTLAPGRNFFIVSKLQEQGWQLDWDDIGSKLWKK